ncbi:hypothetical protein SAMN04487996_12536 [Dyadobacter soli]|uniref:Glycosyl-4,4'-diaponeurosporenoate acyltransferase n=1 Tax=Dyadobacter soli TaxID=659014 RepID=A0A1G7Y2U6_9BACT|nr:hypothetical protein [Dyadobacter soli]SDG90719.1 hypothetical protein SAMN04487996_12536 [Dyadobacter soli]
MLNQLINVLWTIVSFSVVGCYWGMYFAEKRTGFMLYVIVFVSVIAFHVPAKLISALNLSSNTRAYERVGIRAMRWLVQDGMLVSRVNRYMGKSHRTVRNRQDAGSYLVKIAMQERFHYSCFVFFTLSSFSALSTGKMGMALLMTVSNIIYNLYPILLQQYNRLRIKRVLSRLENGRH